LRQLRTFLRPLRPLRSVETMFQKAIEMDGGGVEWHLRIKHPLTARALATREWLLSAASD